MKRNVVKEKSYAYAIATVEISRKLILKKEYVLSRQFLRAGTSIGANIREAEFAQSRADFINKMSISLKEANESDYWLDLLYETKFIEESDFRIQKSAILELLRLLTTIINTTKST